MMRDACVCATVGSSKSHGLFGSTKEVLYNNNHHNSSHASGLHVRSLNNEGRSTPNLFQIILNIHCQKEQIASCTMLVVSWLRSISSIS